MFPYAIGTASPPERKEARYIFSMNLSTSYKPNAIVECGSISVFENNVFDCKLQVESNFVTLIDRFRKLLFWLHLFSTLMRYNTFLRHLTLTGGKLEMLRIELGRPQIRLGIISILQLRKCRRDRC